MVKLGFLEIFVAIIKTGPSLLPVLVVWGCLLGISPVNMYI